MFQPRAQVEAFGRQHRTGLLTLLFTDLVGSAKLKQQLGDHAGVALVQRHHALVREILAQFPEGQEIETAGDSFLLVFAKPSDAVRFALLLQARLRSHSSSGGEGRGEEAHSAFRTPHSALATALQDRIGIHIGEVLIEEHNGKPKPRDLYGAQVDTCARVMSLAGGDQILLTRAAFDNARQALKGEDVAGLGELSWLNHGPYLLAGFDEPLEICEVGERGLASLTPPADAAKAHRKVSPDEEPVLGWRPAVGQFVPHTRWQLEKKLGEGGFGEVWLGRNPTTKEPRVFKFCFEVERVRFLKRELTLFRLLKERVGDHPHIVRLHDVYLERPPYYVEMDYVEGADLRTWSEECGGAANLPLETRLGIVAQIADALQGAHDAGVIHRDIKPANILISNRGFATCDSKSSRRSEAAVAAEPDSSSATEVDSAPQSQIKSQKSKTLAKLTDFGIGQVISQEYLSGITRAGFTQTIMSDSSSSHTGTQVYMAPELLAGKPASIRSDIYSLGVVLYQLLAGDFTRPLTTDWADDVADPLLRDDLKHCFAGNPNDRFAGAGQLAKHLRALPDRHAALAKQRAELAARERAAYRRGVVRAATLALAVVAAMAGLVWYARQQARRADRSAQRERQQRERVEEAARTLRRNVYVADMNVAHEALAENNLWLASELVSKHHPKPGEEDLRAFEWRYMWQLVQGDELHTFHEHRHIATCAVFSPDNQRLATASLDRTVKILDLASKKVLATLPRFTNEIRRNSIAFSPNGRILAVVDGPDISLWDPTDVRQPMRKIEAATSFDTFSSSSAVAFSPDGGTLAVRGTNRVVFWDTATWKPKPVPEGLFKRIGGGLAFSPDGKLLAVSDGEQIEVWNLERQAQTTASPFRFEYASSLRFALNSTVLIAGSYDGNVLLWDIRAGRVLQRWKPNKTLAFGLDVSPDGRTLATGGADQQIHLWDVATQQKLATFKGHRDEIWAIAFSPDGQRLASASKDGSIKLWSGVPKPTANVLTNSLHPLWFSADSKSLLTCSVTYEVQLWDVPTGTLLRTVHLPAHRRTKSWYPDAVSPDGKRLASGTVEGAVEVWDLETQRCAATYRVDGSGLVSPAFSPDGRLLAAADVPKALVHVWDTSTGKEVARYPDLQFALVFSPDGTMLAGASPEDAVKVWNLATGKELANLRGHRWEILQIVFSPDSKLLASGAIDNTARIWDIAAQRERAVLQGHQSGIHTLAFSPDGKTLATGSTDETVKLWSVATGQQLMTLREFKADFGRVLFSPDGTVLAAGSTRPDVSTPVLFWRAPSFEQIQSLEARESLLQSR